MKATTLAKMGRKNRLRKRMDVVSTEVEEILQENADNERMQLVTSDELFQIDNHGNESMKSKRQKLQDAKRKDPLLKSKKYAADKASRYEMKTVKKIQERNQLQSLPTGSKKTGESPLWDATGSAVLMNNVKEMDEYVAPVIVNNVRARQNVPSTRYKVKKVEVPASGQSYHPEFNQHQKVLGLAVDEELQRQSERKKRNLPISKGLSEETLQYINDRSSSDESDSDDEAADDSERKTKTPQAVTRSQRNKRLRHQQVELEHKISRTRKTMTKQINTVSHLLNDIEKEEKMSLNKVEMKKKREEERLSQEPLVRVGGKLVKLNRDLPVSLSEELSGNMRTMKSKGNLLLDRFDSLHKRNLIDIGGPRQTRRRKVKVIETKI